MQLMLTRMQHTRRSLTSSDCSQIMDFATAWLCAQHRGCQGVDPVRRTALAISKAA